MEKRKIVFYLTIGMILILHLTACTNRSSELPAPDSTVFGYEGETKIIFDGARNIMIKKKRIKCFCQLCRF